jgi:hypothetical protein
MPDNKELKEFANQVIKEHCWGIEMDGMEIQDLAEKLGLIAKHTATENDVDEESDFEVGDVIYKFTDYLTSPASSDPTVKDSLTVASSDVVREAEAFLDSIHPGKWETFTKHITALIQSHKELEAERERDLYLEFGKGDILVLTTEDDKVILSRRNGTGVIGDKGLIEDGDYYTPQANDIVMKFTGSKSASVLAEAISDTAEILRKAGK